jgi:hypothetical protein
VKPKAESWKTRPIKEGDEKEQSKPPGSGDYQKGPKMSNIITGKRGKSYLTRTGRKRVIRYPNN